MKIYTILTILIILLFQLSSNTKAQSLSKYISHVEHLSSDKLEGRGNFQPAIWTAAAYIQNEFRKIGITPYNENGYLQQFSISNEEIPYYVANVIGYIPAEKKTEESIIYISHYDGYKGIGKANENGDNIYNAAIDNASGVAALLELSSMFINENPPEKNIVFIATAAEESGSLGSEFYVKNPLFPISNIEIVINIDGFNLYGKLPEVMLMPLQGISYRKEIINIIEEQGFIANTPEWVNSLDTKFDSHRFLQKSVPTITIWPGEKIPGMTQEESKIYISKIGGKMHTQEDEITSLWNWSGVESHLELHKAIGQYYLLKNISGEVTESWRFNSDTKK